MATHTSASLREEAATLREEESQEIDASVKRRARLIMTNGTIPRRTRSLIRYALEKKDRQLGQIVRRVWAGEIVIDHVYLE